jgi:4-diphosphocytidyl-2-C-methyl-D-erythritol kinase
MDTVRSHPAYAKINLHLAVGLPYPDGYHPIQSIFALVSLHDLIEVQWKKSSKFSVHVEGLDVYCKDGNDTLTQAARLWHAAGGAMVELDVRCHKHIPVKAGLGGGSSDAATLLTILGEIDEKQTLDDDVLFSIAQEVGSDVPFFLSSHHCALVTGKGENVIPLDLPKLSVLLVMPTCFNVSTAFAYRALDDMIERDVMRMLDEQELSWKLKRPTSEWKRWFFNDFQACVGHNSYYETLYRLSSVHSGHSGLTGSGACWFFISEDQAEVFAVERKVKAQLQDQVRCWTASTLASRNEFYV